jgi:predicted phosphodiesterase
MLAVLLVAISPCYALSIVTGPYLQNPSRTSMTVMWITDQNCTSWVEYGTGDCLDQKAFHSEHGFIDANLTIHRVAIKGLSPSEKYNYRVCSKEILEFEPYKVTYGETLTGDTHSFKTLAKRQEDISFLVLNDTHQRDDLLTAFVKKAASKPFDMVFLNGDILGYIEDESQIIDHVLKPCSDLFAKETPFIYVRGNHETRGKFARRLPDYIATPRGRYYYSFDHGPVHFVVMDSGEDKDDTTPSYGGLVDLNRYRDEQKVWLEKEIRSDAYKKAAFRIVIVHMPHNQSDRWHGVTDIYNKWRPAFNQGKIDLMISGHTHGYAVVESEKGIHDYPIMIGGGPKDGEATFIQVDASRDKIEVTMTRDDGEVVGTYRIDS